MPVYPEVREDLALIVDEATPAAAVEAALLAAGKPLLCAVELFDVFRGVGVGEGSKSLAYHLTFRAPNRTLRDRDVKKLRQRILGQIGRTVGAKFAGVAGAGGLKLRGGTATPRLRARPGVPAVRG